MRYKVTVAYDGSNYHGWQTQQQGNSIEEKIEEALHQIHHEPIEIVGSGRTDALVHATGQVFHFDSTLDINEQSMLLALNTNLPNDICVQKVEQVSETFHARFDAHSKRYDYYVSKDLYNPFIRNYKAIEATTLDVEAMREASTCFLGTHDFTSFTSAKANAKKDKVRTITRLDILEENDEIHFIFEGTGFLRYMVRMITQTLIMVGKHKEDKVSVQAMLNANDKHACNYKADPQGLYLTKVKYKDDE